LHFPYDSRGKTKGQPGDEPSPGDIATAVAVTIRQHERQHQVSHWIVLGDFNYDSYQNQGKYDVLKQALGQQTQKNWGEIFDNVNR